MRLELPPVLQRMLARSAATPDQALLSDLQQSHPAAAAELAKAIDSSPHLGTLLGKAWRDGHLTSIRFTNESLSGRYRGEDGTIHLNPRRIETYLANPSKGSGEALHDFLVTTLAHETSHALERKDSTRNNDLLHRQVRSSLKQAAHGGVADITDAADRYLSERRLSEARAEQAALNALSSRISHTTGQVPDANTLARRGVLASNCTSILRDGPRLAPGLSPDARGMIPDSQLEAVAQCFFDDSPANLGKQRNVSYHNAYAGFVLRVAEHEKRHGGMEQVPLRLDFKRLGLDPARVQDGGLDFGAPGRVLRVDDGSGRRLQFLHDAGRDPRTSQAPAEAEPGQRTAATSDARWHADPLHQHMQQTLDAQLPAGTSVSDTRVAQLAAAARHAGIQPGEPIELVAHAGDLVVRGRHPTHVARVDLESVPEPDQAGSQPAPATHQHARDLHG